MALIPGRRASAKGYDHTQAATTQRYAQGVARLWLLSQPDRRADSYSARKGKHRKREPTILADPTETLVLGIRACRQGEWRDGLTYLSRLEHQAAYNGQFPGFFYSYLGHAVARCEGRKQDGLAMGLHALEIEPFQPVNYLNLARSYLLARNRQEAIRTLRRGLALDPSHRGLLAFQRRLGIRRRRPLRFLARDNRLNRFLGRLRAKSRVRRKAFQRKQSAAEHGHI